MHNAVILDSGIITECGAGDESKLPKKIQKKKKKVHASMGLIRAVSHLKTQRQEEEKRG